MVSSLNKKKGLQLPPTPDPYVVLSTGSGTVKAGFAGRKTPQAIFPNLIGRPKTDGSSDHQSQD